MKRITIPEVRQHQWFQHKLPAYLNLPPEMIESQERCIDEVTNKPTNQPISSKNKFKSISTKTPSYLAYPSSMGKRLKHLVYCYYSCLLHDDDAVDDVVVVVIVDDDAN